MGAKLDDRAWVEKHFAAIEAIAAKALGVNADVVEPVGAWTVLKQLAIKHILGVYLPILRNQSWAKRLIYIDTHAGCGVNELRGTRRRIAGTALLPFAGGELRFDHYHYVEVDPRKRAALEERLALFLPAASYTMHAEPATEAIGKITAAEKKEGTHFLAVVDPYNMSQIDWNGLVQIMTTSPGDLIFNYPTTEPKRTTKKFAENFFGSAEIQELLSSGATEQELLNHFIRRLQEHRNVVRTIRIESGEGRYYYDLIYATRKTKSDSRFIHAIEEVKAKVERLNGGHVMRMIESPRVGSFAEEPPKGRQGTLGESFDKRIRSASENHDEIYDED